MWKQEPPDMKCSLCGVVSDSHSHLFFRCNYAAEVWVGVRLQMDWHGFPNTWDDMLEALSDTSLAPKNLT